MVKQGSKNDFSWLNKIQAAPELRPTVEEFEDFPRLMNRIIAEGSSAGQQLFVEQHNILGS